MILERLDLRDRQAVLAHMAPVQAGRADCHGAVEKHRYVCHAAGGFQHGNGVQDELRAADGEARYDDDTATLERLGEQRFEFGDWVRFFVQTVSVGRLDDEVIGFLQWLRRAHDGVVRASEVA